MSNVAKPTSEKTIFERVQDKQQDVLNPPTKSELLANTRYKEDPHKKMLAVEWHGSENVKVIERPAPMITDAQDVIVRISSTTICGSDLHMYFNQIPGGSAVMQKGDIIGHEGMGIVDSVGPAVQGVKVGDRVVISAVISCGTCEFCKRKEFSLCDKTNSSSAMESLYGHRCAALFGYSHLTGGYEGTSAEYVRVPFADVNLIKVPDTLTDDQVLWLSDIVCTGWHGNELADVQPGDVVVVWGCGPVGLMAAYLAKVRGAKRVISIDRELARLSQAEKLGMETINFDQHDVKKRLQELVPGGQDKSIDCVGFRFPKTLTQKIQTTIGMSTDAVDVIDEMVFTTRKCGKIALIGDYFDKANGFPIGAFMEKGQSMAGGQLWCQKYMPHLLSLIEQGKIDLRWVCTHKFDFSEFPKAYDMFAHHKDDIIKTIIVTEFGKQLQQQRGIVIGAGLQAKESSASK